MTDFCKVCLTEAVILDDWYLITKQSHGKTAIIECVCPWCVKEMIERMTKDERNIGLVCKRCYAETSTQ